MGNEKISKERTAEPVPNVGAVRRIPVVVWEEITQFDYMLIPHDPRELVPLSVGRRVTARNGVEAFISSDAGKKYLVWKQSW